MLMRTDPFGALDRLTQQLFGAPPTGTWSRPAPMPLDAYRTGDEFIVAFDLPGVSPESIDISTSSAICGRHCRASDTLRSHKARKTSKPFTESAFQILVCISRSELGIGRSITQRVPAPHRCFGLDSCSSS